MNKNTKVVNSLSTIGLASAVLFSSGCIAPPEPVDYSNEENWLCYDGNSQGSFSSRVCDDNLDSLVVYADASSEIETHLKATSPAVDCFYVYPTASTDIAGNSDLFDGIEENLAALNQAARYSEFCRVFAPVYRQSTLASIFINFIKGDRELAYGDVVDAFDYYLENENNGRGFILIGHSQGSGHLRRIISQTIEPNPALFAKLISAHLIGSSVDVATGALGVSDFQIVTPCTTETDTGCVVSFASYRDTDPFLAAGEGRFGLPGLDTQALCTNPAALGGGKVVLDAYFPTASAPALEERLIKRVDGPYDVPGNRDAITHAFYKMPGFLSGQCVVNEDGVSYLEISMNADPDDPRADDYNGEFTDGEGWGLHLIDINMTMGNLVDLGAAQAQSWLGQQ